MTVIYYSGAEIPGWRRLMVEHGIEHAALSYIGLRRRTKMVTPWLVREKVKEQGLHLLLDSGGFSVNSRPTAYDVPKIVAEYESFVANNIDDVEYVLDMDVLALGPEHRAAHRARLGQLAAGKLVPVWHGQDGLDALYALARDYPMIAVADLDKVGREVILLLHLQELARSGTRFLGVAMLKPDKIKELPFAAVTGSSWLSPIQHGETVIYTGGELHRFHAKYQQTARTRYRTQIEAMGLDPVKIADGDSNELLGLSLRSWQAFVTELVTKHPHTVSERNGDPGMEQPAGSDTEKRHRRRQKQPMPGLEVTDVTADDGTVTRRELTFVDPELRECNSCYIRDHCRAYEQDADCAFEIPMSLTEAQIRALRTRIQVARVIFARNAEELEGGYPNPVVSTELDRLDRMMLTDHKLDTAEFTLHMKASKAAGRAPAMDGGIISAIFGREAPALEAPAEADPMVQQILDAEVVEDKEEQ